ADSAIGQPGVAARASRSVRIDMNDRMRFSPERLAVRQGETVRLVVRNTGQVPHELSLGTLQDLLAHRDQMARQPGMAHAEPNQITLAPGQQGEIVWHFSRAGTVHFACLIPGHYEAGMRGEIQIRSSGQH
ncbi:MAG TPA: cupredoxin family protein, partial [Ottowia sp.]|nr:cupredoxin family protein [Ottowia sp.]